MIVLRMEEEGLLWRWSRRRVWRVDRAVQLGIGSQVDAFDMVFEEEITRSETVAEVRGRTGGRV